MRAQTSSFQLQKVRDLGSLTGTSLLLTPSGDGLKRAA